MNSVVALFQIALLAVCAVPVLYLLFLMAAASFYRRPSEPENSPLAGQLEFARFVILIPAHNEGLTLPATLQTVKRLQTAANAVPPRIVVIADNCTDNTAQIAREKEVEVYERTNVDQRGKGRALEWAIPLLLKKYSRAELSHLVILDADTVPDQAFLQEAQHAINCGAKVIQARYDVLQPRQSWRTLLMYSAFIIYNHVRPLGRAALGLSDGLRGNGMVFGREVLEEYPWQAFSLVEDIEYSTRLALGGLVVKYVPEAKIYGQAAASTSQATSQRMRWEGGRLAQARQDLPPLLKRAFAKKDFIALDRAVDLLIPPLAMLIAGLGLLALLNGGLWYFLNSPLIALSFWGFIILLLGMVLFVFGGLMVGRAPSQAYLALLFAPLYIVWKLGLYFKMIFQKTPQEWVRTSRSTIELNEVQVNPGFEKRG